MSQYLTIEQIAQRWSQTPKHVCDRVVKRPDFPPPDRMVSTRARWWLVQTIEAWEARAAQQSRQRSRGSTPATGADRGAR
jgi:predicted DNA-binding transcriptional regulator AlpA